MQMGMFSMGQDLDRQVLPRAQHTMEEDILALLRQSPGQPFSVKEIGKNLDRNQFREDPNWARPFIHSLLHRHSIEKDSDGRFFVLVAPRL